MDGTVEKETKPWIDVIDSENRRYPRFDIHLPIEYHQIKSSFAHTRNISESGSLVFFPEEMDVSQSLGLKLFFPLASELNTIKVLAEAVWMDNHLSEDHGYFQYGVKFIDIPPKDKTKLRNFLGSLSSPLDDMPSLYNTLKVRFWMRKLINSPREYISGRQVLEIFTLLARSDGNRKTKKPASLRNSQF